MISYQMAKQKAMNIDKSITRALEYSDAFVFTNDSEDDDAVVVILKANGESVDWVDYYSDHDNKDKPKQIKF